MPELIRDKERIPQHVAVIMDGNGRWAKERGMARVQGHNAGMKALKEIVKHSDVLGVKYLTVYAFSTENWKRPADEVSGIFRLLVLYVAQELKELHQNNVKVQILGDWSALPEDAVKAVRKALDTTKDNTGLVFSIAINYGGRAEIARAARLIAEKAAAGELDPEVVDEKLISDYLYTSDMPDPDMIIRTGGELRVSNFLIWQGAYSELVVTPVYWPDFTPERYEEAIAEFQTRDRRFGGIK
jgi:undecaprenyl diphosphate synthase